MKRIGAVLAIAAGAWCAAPGAAFGQALTVYSSVPLQGAGHAQSLAVVRGEKLALAEAGASGVRLRSLDDSTRRAGAWTPEATAANARRAALDRSSIAYIGDLNSSASSVSIPILNEAGLATISPSDTATGLTKPGPDTSPGEPDKYYPTGARTFFRLQPPDSVQGGAVVAAMKAAGCANVALLNDRERYGKGLAAYVAAGGIPVVKSVRIERRARRASPRAASPRSSPRRSPGA